MTWVVIASGRSVPHSLAQWQVSSWPLRLAISWAHWAMTDSPLCCHSRFIVAARAVMSPFVHWLALVFWQSSVAQLSGICALT